MFRAPQSCAIVAFFIIARAAFGYLFLVLIVRIVGRRPGKQLTPFEFVLIFYLGGLTLTGMLSGAVCEKLIGVGPLGKAWNRSRSRCKASKFFTSKTLLVTTIF